MSTTLRGKWLEWQSVPWLASTEAAGPIVQLCDRLLRGAVESWSVADFLAAQLPQISAEFSAQWTAVIRRSPDWGVVGECGRRMTPELPIRFLEEVLDRGAAGLQPLESPPGGAMIAVPVDDRRAGAGQILVIAGRNVAEDDSAATWAVARALDISLTAVADREKSASRIRRLRNTLELASTFASTRESRPLLELIAGAATRLLDCDRASIFIWDRERKEVVACPALGVEGGTLRLPDNVGIVGAVIHNGETIRVDDAYTDPRFNRSVDHESGYVTRNLLCVPLRDEEDRLVGAFEVINKHHGGYSDDDEELLGQLGTQAAVAVRNTREREQLVRSRRTLTEQVTRGTRIIGESPAIAALRATVERLAATDLPVLILGESGTGKEVVAQSLHYQGPRADHPFVAVNCAALTETLLESELFGHEKGAFTDAHESRPGKFELAEGGTLFLDEIGDMSPGGQAKLLRVLEQKVITRVGGSRPIPINVRVIAATNANLQEAVRNKKFREDLFFRLSVVTQLLPPLRDRPEDILPLAEFFLRQYAVQASRPSLSLTSEARRHLQAHAWPGNVRELRNLMERVAFLSAGERVETTDLAFIISPDRETLGPTADMGLAEATDQFQQDYIRRMIKRVQGNMSEAARMLGLHRSNLYRKMRQLEMEEGRNGNVDEL